jgi:hypothetical protein
LPDKQMPADSWTLHNENLRAARKLSLFALRMRTDVFELTSFVAARKRINIGLIRSDQTQKSSSSRPQERLSDHGVIRPICVIRVQVLPLLLC